MTLGEVAAYLRVHPTTIYRLLKRGLIPAFKVGSDWRFNRESIVAWTLSLEEIGGIRTIQQPAKNTLESF